MRNIERDIRAGSSRSGERTRRKICISGRQRTVLRAPWRARSALARIGFGFQRRALVGHARRSCGDIGGVAVGGTVRGGVARLVADGLALALWNGLGFAGRFETLLAWHGWGASNIRAQDRERIRSIAYPIRLQWSGDYTNVAAP